MNCDPTMTEQAVASFTVDTILGGRLQLLQPVRGHRVGHDTVLLAAACPAQSGEQVVELGAGVGAAGLALALRVPGLTMTLVEVDPELAALADRNIALNNLVSQVRTVVLDVAASSRIFDSAGVGTETAMRVLMNPPFHEMMRENASPDRGRRLAHIGTHDTLSTWIAAAARLLKPRGTVTLIWRADGLAAVLQSLSQAFGGVAVLPIHPKPNAPAIRLLVRATKASRAPLVILPGLVLNDREGRPTPDVEAVLREGGCLPLARVGATKSRGRLPT
jgi:tRNA1(Val) A37 N6-methylase TrmN6